MRWRVGWWCEKSSLNTDNVARLKYPEFSFTGLYVARETLFSQTLELNTVG